MERLRNDKGAVDGGKYITTKYVQELNKPDPCCPLCSRKFEREQEIRTLVQDVIKGLFNIVCNAGVGGGGGGG